MFQGHVYSLIGVSGDDRFALMHAGYKHSHGADGFPKDLDMAYGYYSNIGSQSSIDTYQIHENKVSKSLHICLKRACNIIVNVAKLEGMLNGKQVRFSKCNIVRNLFMRLLDFLPVQTTRYILPSIEIYLFVFF